MSIKRNTGYLVGTGKNDTFKVSCYTVSIDGKGGDNTAIFSYDISNYIIYASGAGYYVEDILTGQNVYMTNVQILQFGGGAETYYDTTGVFAPNSSGAVIGTAGDDAFTVTSTWSSVNGEAGNNTAIFASDISAYTICASGSGFNMTDSATGQNLYVSSVQTLKFNSGEVYMDMTGVFVPDASGTVIGTAGDDTFEVTSAWKSVNGEGGNNTAIFARDISGYAVTQSGPDFTVLDTATGQRISLSNVQKLEFNGGTEIYSSTGTLARSAADFVHSLGVNTHLGNWTLYENVDVVQSSLSYLGIGNIRDELRSISDAQAEYQQLAAAGVKFDFLIRTDIDLATFQSQLDSFVTANPGSLAAIEGPNEVDQEVYTYNGSSTLSADAQLQQALYKAVKADSKIAAVPVFNLTVVQPASYTGVGDLSTSADYANVHAYVWSGSPPNGALTDYVARGQIDAPGRPTVFTETGYTTMPTDPAAVDETVDAKYILDTLMDAFQAGIASTYVYELLDEVADPGNLDSSAHFGLFHNDGTPKLAATAIHDLTTILADPTGSSVGGRLDFSVAGLPSDGHDMLLQKSDGTFDLILWAEPNIWNQTTLQEIPAPTVDTTVNFTNLQNVSVYDPLQGATPIATSSGVQSVLLHLTDHPLIVSLNPF